MKTISRTKVLFLSFFLIGLFANPISTLNAQEIDPPTCYGGNKLLKAFIKEEMIYPELALKKNIEGTVELSFLVEPNGNTSNLNIEQSVSPEIDKEATRIFKKILWNPANELGKPIAYAHSIKIKFNIKKYKKLIKERSYNYFSYPYQPIDSSNHVYDMKEVNKYPKPIFSSTDVNFNSFLARNLKYPETAFKQNISGEVKLKFVVEQSGRISNIKIVNTLGGGTTEEAIRVLKLMKWHPGIKKGKAVRTFMQIEIKFDIANHTVGGTVPIQGR
ncbi:MAG: energy transducer TonB [Chlorobi bacterium]|nr:energy transducer TonB [Chlorobiota bacterium]